jgi:hypothetical protein
MYWEPERAAFVVNSTPLMMIASSLILYGVYGINQKRIKDIHKGFLLILGGIIPIILTIFFLSDNELQSVNLLRTFELYPILLIGLFLLSYEIYKIIDSKANIKSDQMKIIVRYFGLSGFLVGLYNPILFVIVIILFLNLPAVLLISWLLMGFFLTAFGFKLTIKKVNSRAQKYN